MNPWFETVFDSQAGAEVLGRRRYGVIEAADSGLLRVRLRPWAKWISLWEVGMLGERLHARRAGNFCRLYYNQPLGHSNFLALKYLVSSRGCTLATMHAALATLDEIARLKQTDAILCEASNFRLSGRLMARYGWQAHKPSPWRRHYIKRFYGVYPAGGTA